MARVPRGVEVKAGDKVKALILTKDRRDWKEVDATVVDTYTSGGGHTMVEIRFGKTGQLTLSQDLVRVP